MKLSAPPPPPPEPPEPGVPPGDAGPPGPDAAAPTPPPADLPPAPPKPPAKLATWPLWHAGADTTIVILAVAVAFLIGSFAARNSDLWLHLAAGKMLTTGEYSLGSDPFSFTAADRPWVNHSWLFDLGSYLLYRGDGFALVLVKALAVAGAVALLIGIRRPGHALWPWAAVAVVAAIAAGPRLTLSPLVGSFVFLAVTLFLVFRVPSPPGSWRLPIGIGVTFWLWANTDAWFFVGPLSLALLLVGELIRTKGLNAEGSATTDDDPLGPLPDALTLAKALGVGVVACMLNPHHVRVWDLPYELIGGPGTEDPRLGQMLTSPLTGQYWDSVTLGYNVNGLAFALLLAGGLYAVALTAVIGRLVGRPWDVEPLPLPHALLWCGLAALALKSIFAVPFLAVVSVPLLAGRLNALSARVTLGTLADARTRAALALSTVGRLASVVGLIALGVCAWPGWLHTPTTNPAYARRVAWEVAPDPALAKAAAQFGEWRAAGRLGPTDRGFVGALDLANYIAWYAPGEKVFVNARYAHHRAEWVAFGTARKALGVVRSDAPPDARELAAVFDAHKLTYAAVSVSPTDAPATRALTKEASLRMWAVPERWAAWYIDGRTAVSGWRPTPAATPPTFDKLRVDPVAQVFGPAAAKLPAALIDPIPPPRLWLDDFIRPARPASPAADEAIAWLEYREQVSYQRQIDYQLCAALMRMVPSLEAPPLAGNMFQFFAENAARNRNPRYTPPADGSFTAIPLLALKAARRAVADNPDHPDSYYAVGRAVGDPGLPINESERVVGVVTALRQCLSRFPPPEEFTPGVYLASPTQVAQELAALYAGNPQQNQGIPGIPVDLPGVRDLAGMTLRAQGGQQVQVPYHYAADLAQEAMALSLKYAERELPSSPDDSRERKDAREQLLRGLKQQADRFQAARKQATDDYRRAIDLNPKVKERFDHAVRSKLTGEAIRMVKEMPAADLEREFGAETADVYLRVTALQVAVGRVEDAAADAAELRPLLDRLVAQPNPPQSLIVGRALLRAVEMQMMVLTGNYEAAGRELEATEGRLISKEPPPPPADYLPFHWPVVSVVPSFPATVNLGMFYRHRFGLYLQARQQIQVQQDREAAFFFRRGYFSLLEGEIEDARVRFRASRRPPIPAWDITETEPPVAPVYLKWIEAAAKR